MLYNNGEPVGKVIIQLAPTGIVPTKENNSSVPITPDEIIEETVMAYRMGVSSVHLHARDEIGRSTGRTDIYQKIVSGIRKKCPDMIICTSTTCRIEDGERDGSLICRPDFASLTMGSVLFRSSVSVTTFDDIEYLACLMHELNIRPELEIFEPGFINTVKYLVKKGVIHPPLHCNLILGSLGSSPADIRDISYLVDSLPQGTTWAASGIGRFHVQVAAAAILMGGHIRIGLEDTLYGDFKHKTPTTNRDLIQRVITIAEALGREIATPAEARKILSLL